MKLKQKFVAGLLTAGIFFSSSNAAMAGEIVDNEIYRDIGQRNILTNEVRTVDSRL